MSTTKRRRYVFPDRATAEARVGELERAFHVARACLDEAVAGNVTWFERGYYRVGLVRPTHAHGGMAILTWAPPGQRPSSTSWYLDDLARTHSVEWSLNAGNKEAHDLAHLIVLVVLERDRIAGYAPPGGDA
jgi:hypothetical protein